MSWNRSAVGTNKDVPLQVAHMEKTMFWVVAQNGECPDAYSDTVVVTVKSASDPTLGISSPICEKITDATLTVTVPAHLTADFKWNAVQWQRRVYTEGMAADEGWQDITITTSVSGQPATATITDASARTLSPGTYQYRYHYDYGTQGYSNAATLQIDATSKGGKLTVDNAVVCQDGVSPILSLTGDVVGDIVAGSLKSGTAMNNITTSVGGTTNPLAVYTVPTTAANVGKKIYRLEVKNGACPAVNSDTVAVEVIRKPVAGSLAVGAVVCYNNGTTSVTLSGNTGSSIVWSTAGVQSGPYADVPNTDKTSYTAGPLTDRLWVRATVNTNGVCSADTTTPVEVKVYDTIKITSHPANVSAVGTNQTKTFSVTAATAGLTYKGGGSFEPINKFTYQWQSAPSASGPFTNLSNGGDYSGVTTATLTVGHAENHADTYYRCVVTSDPCGRALNSNSATIRAMEALDPGNTKSKTEGIC